MVDFLRKEDTEYAAHYATSADRAVGSGTHTAWFYIRDDNTFGSSPGTDVIVTTVIEGNEETIIEMP